MSHKRSSIGPLALAFSLLVHIGIAYAVSGKVLKATSRMGDREIVASLKFKKTFQKPKEIIPPRKEALPPPEKPKLAPKPKPQMDPKKIAVPTPPPPPPPEPVAPPPVQVASLPQPPGPMIEEERKRREREAYFSEIMQQVERMKYYPIAARRRGIQETVDITFEVNPQGGVENLRAEASSPILKKAAMEAVIKSAPLPPPPGGASDPLKVRIAMKYALE